MSRNIDKSTSHHLESKYFSNLRSHNKSTSGYSFHAVRYNPRIMKTALAVASELSKCRSSPSDVDCETHEDGQSRDERPSWSRKTDFILSVIGFSVDFTTLWRFPYMCYKHGGGAFLLPYLMMLLILGIPLSYMELALGQYQHTGAISVWLKICPMFCGIGYGVIVVATLVGSYYNTMIGWSVYFLISSFQSEVPWGLCNQTWNTPDCVTADNIGDASNTSVSAAEEFFDRRLLEIHRSTGLADLGPVKLSLAACLLGVFIVIYICLWKGIKYSGQIVWVTATTPYVILTMLLIHGITLSGSLSGIRQFLYPTWNSLVTWEVWTDAASQIFLSLGPGCGVLLTLASYNGLHNNCFRDAVITSLANCAASLLAGFVVFSVLGYMADLQHTTIDKVVVDGPGLVFVAYPQVIATFAGSHFWAVLFFFMLIALGLDSSFGRLECTVMAMCDHFPNVKANRPIVLGVQLGLCFLIGLSTVTYGGAYVVHFLDNYAASVALIFFCLLQVVAVSWLYGFDKFSIDIHTMLGSKPSIFWKACWVYMCPVTLLVLLVVKIRGCPRLELRDIQYPAWSVSLGWCVTCSSVLCVPGFMIYWFITSKGNFKQRMQRMVYPVNYTKYAQTVTPRDQYKILKSEQPTKHVKWNINENEITEIDDVTSTSYIKMAVTTFQSSSDVSEKIKKSKATGGGADERVMWNSKADFLLTVIGYAVDSANVWRFPYICYKNGGGAFLIPYLLMFFFVALPLFYMELALGQFQRAGAMNIWLRISPMFSGMGWGVCVVCMLVGAYYNTINAWSFYFIVDSFKAELPWGRCGQEWNTPDCMDENNARNITNTSISSADEYFERQLLESHRSTGIDDLGGVKWSLCLCLLLTFLIIYFTLWKGIQQSGKMAWVTALSPYVVLFLMLILGCTLPGAANGVKYYIVPDFERLLSPEVWIDAAGQIFFSLGTGIGALIALGSYNKFNNNCLLDAVLTSSINCATSIVSGFAVFSMLGYMAEMQHTTVDKVATEGPGMVFVACPLAIATMDGSQFWSIIFFIMLITLGLGSSFGAFESVLTALCDQFPKLSANRPIVLAIVLTSCFLISLPSVTYGGSYVVNLLDLHAAPTPLIFFCFIEVVAVNWVYGWRRFSSDIEQMLGQQPSMFWKVCWVVISPISLLVLLIQTVYKYPGLMLGDYVYPAWSVTLGWCLTSASIMCVPGFMIYSFFAAKGNVKEKIRKIVYPTESPIQVKY
ncbi:uncharacterized protein LOC121368494 [Gigantopelta aegis]|uniref:uncharacterized protein LOC121368494 n=1 Tax=Gigantopelta aegis TaxID=1735272 RepID=UPI001B88A3BD|nr:uncharacterized protein LOC121368494 [Gigantopelta aegis]